MVNLVKTKEMIFHRPDHKLVVFPNKLDCIQRVNAFKLLGMVLEPNLTSKTMCLLLSFYATKG
jgi:hypothetical protein